jgi:hypothetical protein
MGGFGDSRKLPQEREKQKAIWFDSTERPAYLSAPSAGASAQVGGPTDRLRPVGRQRGRPRGRLHARTGFGPSEPPGRSKGRIGTPRSFGSEGTRCGVGPEGACRETGAHWVDTGPPSAEPKGEAGEVTGPRPGDTVGSTGSLGSHPTGLRSRRGSTGPTPDRRGFGPDERDRGGRKGASTAGGANPKGSAGPAQKPREGNTSVKLPRGFVMRL